MDLLKDLPELIKAGVITDETAQKIQDYYKVKSKSSNERVFIAFGVLGAILVGLGIILILAHNWDELSRFTKTIFAFLPLLLGQLLCGFILIQKINSTAWRESGSAFLFFAIGACISLVSQIYNIPGNLSSFLLTWMLLGLPLVYLMKSSISSLLYLMGITYYAVQVSYFTYPLSQSYLYWLLLLLVLPRYYLLYKEKPRGNFMTFHNWFVPISILIAIGTVAKNVGELMPITYMSLYGLFYLIGNNDFFTQQRPINNGYKTIGSLGTVIFLLISSFDWYWEELRKSDLLFDEIIRSPEFFAASIISLSAGLILYINLKNKTITEVKPLETTFIIFIFAYALGIFSPLVVIAINILILLIGILTIREGGKQNHLGILNSGLLVITALVVCRFFDTDLSFVIRGILFVSVGIGFFTANYLMIKKRSTHG